MIPEMTHTMLMITFYILQVDGDLAVGKYSPLVQMWKNSTRFNMYMTSLW